MKKLFSVLLCIAVLFSLSVPAFAADTASLRVQTAVEEGKLTVTLSAPADAAFATFETALQYDADKLTLQNVEFRAGDMTTKNTDTAGAAHVYMIWTDALSQDSVLAVFTFAVQEDAKGVADFTFTDTRATDAEEQEIAVGFDGQTGFSVRLAEPEPTDTEIPSTAGVKKAAVGAAAVIALATAVTAGALYKRKKDI